jgi:catechol 2,3-dioxygenase-like lactoylglutathione lyase family enzyme
LGAAFGGALSVAETAGVRIFVTDPLDIARGGRSLVERIDHLGIACANNQAAVAVFNERMGLPVESQQTDVEVETAVESFTSDKYGVVYHSRTPRVVGGLRVAFLTAGDCELEFLQNFDPSQGAAQRDGAAGTTRQDQGAITRFIAAHGAGLHHVALKTPDIDGTLLALERSGARMIDRVGRPGSRRARIGFVHPASFGGVLFHLVQRE